MYWDRLLRDANEHPSNMKVWFEMRSKFEDQLQSYMDEDDEAEFKKQTDEIKRKAKDKKKRKKQEKKAAAAAAKAKGKEKELNNVPEDKENEEL